MPASVDLVTRDLAVAPGGAISTTIRMTNTGRIVDEFSLDVLGDAAGYASVDPPQLPLFPGASAEATVTFRPPRSPLPPAGTVAFGVRVRAREDRAFSLVVEGSLNVGVVMDVGAHLLPRTSVASRLGQGARHRVEIANASNTATVVRLAAADADERLAFRIAQPVLSIPAGGRASTTISVKGRSRMVTGMQAMLPFQVTVAPDGSVPIVLDGTMTQRSTLVGGTSQIIALVAVVGVAGVLATQALPLLTPTAASPAATPGPSATLAPPTAVAGSVSTTIPETGAPATAPIATGETPGPTAAPTPEPTATPAPSTPPPTEEPTASPTDTPAATPLAIRILNLGLVDPQGQVPEQTPTPEPTPAPTGGGPPIRVFPSFPTRLMSGSGIVTGGNIAVHGPLTQDRQPGLPVQQFGIQVNGPVSAAITRVSDNTTPTICLVPIGGTEECHSDFQALAGTGANTEAQTWFMSVTAQQGGTSVDVKIDYLPQPAVFGFKDLHLAGVSAGSGVHVVIQASDAGLIEIVTEVNIGADVTVSVRDLNTQLAAPPSTTPAGISGAPFVAAAEPGHLYDILITSTSADEVFVSGTISWP